MNLYNLADNALINIELLICLARHMYHDYHRR